MENQNNEVNLENDVETVEKPKWYKSTWFKNSLLVAGGALLTAGISVLLKGDSDEDDVCIEGSTDADEIVSDVSYEVTEENDEN